MAGAFLAAVLAGAFLATGAFLAAGAFLAGAFLAAGFWPEPSWREPPGRSLLGGLAGQVHQGSGTLTDGARLVRDGAQRLFGQAAGVVVDLPSLGRFSSTSGYFLELADDLSPRSESEFRTPAATAR